MSGYTERTPSAVLTTLIEDFQGPGSINPQDIRDLFVSAMSVEPNTQTTSYTLVLTDAWLCVEMNAAGAVTLTIPLNSSVAFQVGTVIEWYQMGAGQVTFAGSGGVTMRTSSSLTSRAQFSSGAMRQRAANEWVLTGELT